MKSIKKIISVIMAVCLILSVFSVAVYGESSKSADEVTASLPFAAISDIHYYPQSYTGGNCAAWQEYCTLESKEYQESNALLETALDSIEKKAEETGTKYLLIPGDLTKDSEYQAHVDLAAALEKFEQRTGIQVFVTNGNHDINNNKACTFENGKKEDARCITQAEFREVYKNLGFDLAKEEYVPPVGSTQGGLSYVADLDDNYTLIVLDSNKYDAVNPAKDQTDGMISDELLHWAKDKAEEATDEGKTPIVMMHHSLAPHMKLEPSVTFAFCVDDYQNIAEQLADAGVHYAFTGHLHTNDIASVTSDNGETLYDCEVGSITGYPNTIREMIIKTYGNGESKMDFDMIDVDYAHEVTIGNTTYEKPFSTASFAINYGGRMSDDGNADAVAFFMGIVKSYLLPYLDKIEEAGGIDQFLKSMGIDLEEIISTFLDPYIGSGVKVGNVKIFTVDNIMWFIDDLLGQIQQIYIDNPDNLITLLESLLTKIANFEVSDVPCTKFIDTLHFGSNDKAGTFGDFILSIMYYWYKGNEDISDDAFVTDAIDGFKNGDTADRLLNFLVDTVYNDLVNSAILGKLNVRLDKLVNDKTLIGKDLADNITYVTKVVLKNDTSYLNLVNTFFKLGILPYSSLYDILDKKLIKEYVTTSQIDSIGDTLAYCISDFTTDVNPQPMGDFNVTYSTDTVVPEATTDNYRLPTMVSNTIGEDSTSAYINWFSKSTVKGTDIEIYKADSASDVTFTGIPTDTDDVDFNIAYTSSVVERNYPGIDLGVIGFFKYYYDMNRHTITLSELEAGSKYYYRIGDAEKGWWSATGCIETPDGSNNVTFFHMSDPQSQNEEQYTTSWANVVSKAFELYPSAKFIMCTGDLVDYGDNTNQWQWMFDTASDNLMNTYLMPATGNHEGKAENSTVNNFTLPNVPEQDTTSGVYYSYDYNNVHVMVLNSNDLNDSDALSDAQIEWLKADSSASDAQWKVVAIHKAPYSNGSHYDDDDVCAIRDQLATLMPELGIDLVLTGHDHVYLRTYSMNANKVVDSSRTLLSHNGKNYVTDVLPSGTTYVISGTAGVKTYLQKDASLTDEYFPRGEVIEIADTSMFSAIQIEGGILYFDAYKVDGDTTTDVDSFAIQKDTTEGVNAGDADDVKAKDHNGDSAFVRFFKKLFTVLKRIFNVISNIFNIYK